MSATRRRIVRIVLACVAGIVVAAAATAQERAAGTPVSPSVPRALATAPVLYEGRAMPLETAGRLVLYRLSGRNRVGDADAGSWFVRLLLYPFRAIEDPVFLVNNPSVLESIDVPDPRRGRYSYLELYPYINNLGSLAFALSQAGRALDSTEEQVIDLANSVRLFEDLASTFDVFRGSTAAGEGAETNTDTRSAVRRYLMSGEFTESSAQEYAGMLPVFPVEEAGEVRWLTPAAAITLVATDPAAPAHVEAMLQAWDIMLPAYILGDQNALDQGAQALSAALGAARSSGLDLGPIGLEAFHTRLEPVRWAGWALLAGLILFLLLRRSATAVGWARLPIGAAVAFLSAHQVIRFLITHRPPVVDLPASFLFVAWIIAIVGFVLMFSRIDVARIGVLLSTLGGLGLVYLARLVSGGSDTFGVVRAVLDTNFWLTTHVLVITAGYAGVVAAGVTGHVYLIGRLARPYQSSSHQVAYRVMFILLLAGLALSFLGTILGGIWADQSWGRFWGWDPKENGALLIVLWTAIALHARVTRWFDQAAFAAANVAAIVVVIFSWLGVNLMGVGLHSYGFNDSSFFALVGITGVELVFAVVAWLWVRFGTHERGMVRRSIASLQPDGDAVLMTLSGEPTAHHPGQHAGLKPEGFSQARPFSFADAMPAADRFLIAAAGPVSAYFAEKARAGEPVWMSASAGEFTFATPDRIPVVMVAGGVGVAPLLGLARRALETGHTTTMVCANRAHGYLDHELQELAGAYPEFVMIGLLSAPAAGWTGATGRISDGVVGELLRTEGRSGAGADWYVCGSPDFCTAAREAARSNGARAVHEEPFTGSLRPPPPPNFVARLTIAGSGTQPDRVLNVRPGQTILAAALDAGARVSHSCMSGTCGECRCTIVSGSAVQAAEPRQAGPGDEIVSCVAYPADPDGLTIRIEDEEP